MRNPDRIDGVLEVIRHEWEKYPDLRLGQLLLNFAGGSGGDELYFIEDDKLVELIIGS